MKEPEPEPNGRGQRARGAADWRPAYIAALAVTGVYQWAARDAGVSVQTAWQERQKNPEFAAAEKASVQAATLLLEGEAVRRATHGLRKYKFTPAGEPVMDPRTGEQYYELEFSDTLLITLLKGKIPEVYRDKIEHSGEVKHKHLTLADLQERLKEARA